MAEAFVKAHPEIFGDEEEEEDSDQETFHDAHPLPQTEPQGDEFSDVKKTSGASITPGSISQHIRENGLKPDEEEKDENKKEAEKEETEEELSKRERKEREDALTQEEREVRSAKFRKG